MPLSADPPLSLLSPASDALARESGEKHSYLHLYARLLYNLIGDRLSGVDASQVTN